MAGDAEHKRGYRTIFRSISQVFYANAKNTNNSNSNISNTNNNNNSDSQCQLSPTQQLTSATIATPAAAPATLATSATSATSEQLATRTISTIPTQPLDNINLINPEITVTLTSVTTPATTIDAAPSPLSVSRVELEDKNVAKLRASSMQNLSLGMALNSGQANLRNYMVKVRRKGPQVPIRNPNTALTRAGETNKRENEEEDKANPIQIQKEEVEKMEQDEDIDGDGYGEESIYQPIWQFKTLEPHQCIQNESEEDDEHFEIINVSGDDTEIVAGITRHMVTKRPSAIISTGITPSLTQLPASPPTPLLPSPTISMDQSAWETAGDEFQFSNELETLSLGSTVTNSTATLGSISSSISNTSASTPVVSIGSSTTVLIHPILRNICIIYSPKEPNKYSAIYYDYQRSLIHQKFMTRPQRIQKYHRPAPPIPNSNKNNISNMANSSQNDDSGCSCEDPPGLDALKEEWALVVLASAASTKRGAGAALAAGPRSARKLRVRSQARLLLTDSVLAWREQLQCVNYCEDEEDMIVPVTDILRAQQIQEDNEVQQTQQTTILQRFKSASIGNLTDLPGEDDKKSIKNRVLMKFANVNGFRINRSPKSEKKSRQRRSQVNSLYLDEQSKYPLFAAPLNVLELNMTDHPNVPRFVVDICAYIEQADSIEQDGLYRVSGNKLLVDELKRKLTHLYDPRFLQTDDVHTLTSLHKQFFRELTAPLITQEAYERLGRQLTDEGSIERMRLAFDEMPEPNRSTLRFLIKHLTKVAAASALNRMPASNLAIVWGPCLLTVNQIQFDIGRMNMLAKILIENHDRIFRPENERLVC